MDQHENRVQFSTPYHSVEVMLLGQDLHHDDVLSLYFVKIPIILVTTW